MQLSGIAELPQALPNNIYHLLLELFHHTSTAFSLCTTADDQENR